LSKKRFIRFDGRAWEVVITKPKVHSHWRPRKRIKASEVHKWEGYVLHPSLPMVFQIKGNYRRFLVCVRRVFAGMAQGGAPYGPH